MKRHVAERVDQSKNGDKCIPFLCNAAGMWRTLLWDRYMWQNRKETFTRAGRVLRGKREEDKEWWWDAEGEREGIRRQGEHSWQVYWLGKTSPLITRQNQPAAADTIAGNSKQPTLSRLPSLSLSHLPPQKCECKHAGHWTCRREATGFGGGASLSDTIHVAPLGAKEGALVYMRCKYRPGCIN